MQRIILLFVLTLCFLILLVSTAQGIFIAYPLLLTLTIITFVYVWQGFTLQSLIRMAIVGSQKSFSILIILLLIGALTSVWMAAGTIPALIYYGVKVINPQYFILSAFILTSFVSLLIGTSFGTVSTIGVTLMAIARGSNVNLPLIAGTIIAGAYFGDRCSPMSSSAHLIASLTETNIYQNLKNMMSRSNLVSLLGSILVYGVLSWLNPIAEVKHSLTLAINQVFEVNFIVLLPALVILVLSLVQIEVKLTMLVSVIIALAIGIEIQHYSLAELFKFVMLGYSLEEPSLNNILRGGGVLSMAKVSLVVIISTAIAGIFAGTKTLSMIERFVNQAKSRRALFLRTITISLAAAAFGCTQTIAIVLTQQLVQKKYEQEQLDNYQLAVDLENTAVVLSPLIPWNIAGLVPVTVLMTDSSFIPYAFYLYFLPLFYLARLEIKQRYL
ncbi:Na+/H+ antiporter NhaC family protein [Myxosarcina sp. GI1(2024)]